MTINRKTQQVAVDRLDGNWSQPKPFIGRRDTFYVENREGDNSMNGSLTFVRHDFWILFCERWSSQLFSQFSAWSYKRAFGSQQVSQ